MKSLATALGCALSLSLVIFAVLSAFLDVSVHAATISAVSTVPLTGVSSMAEAFERWQARKSLAPSQRTSISPPERFAISWPVMAAFGAIILFAAIQAGAGVIGFLAAALDVDRRAAFGLISIFGNLVLLLGAFFVGRWIGSRCRSKGVLAVVVITFSGLLLVLVFDALVIVWFFPDLLADGLWSPLFGGEASMQETLTPRAVQLALALIFGLIGYWRGRRRMTAKYLGYLLGVLPPETRELLVHLAYEEAERVGSAPPAAQPVPLQAKAA